MQIYLTKHITDIEKNKIAKINTLNEGRNDKLKLTIMLFAAAFGFAIAMSLNPIRAPILDEESTLGSDFRKVL